MPAQIGVYITFADGLTRGMARAEVRAQTFEVCAAALTNFANYAERIEGWTASPAMYEGVRLSA